MLPFHRGVRGILETIWSIPRSFLFFLKINLFYLFILFLAALGLHCYTRALSNCGEQGLLFVVVHGLLIVVASLVVEHGL